MASWSIKAFLCDMEDAAFDRFKNEFAQTHRHFIQSSNKAGLSAAFSILFSEKHFALLDRGDISDLIDALFADQMKDTKWLVRYMDELVTYLPKDNDAKKIGYEERADKYFKHVHDTLPALFKKGISDGRDLTDDVMRECLRDQVHFVFALRNEWKGVGLDVTVIKKLSTTLHGNENVDDLFFNERPASQPAEEKKKVLGIKLPPVASLLPAHSMHGDDKQLAILLTRALLCDLLTDITENEGEE